MVEGFSSSDWSDYPYFKESKDKYFCVASKKQSFASHNAAICDASLLIYLL